MNGADHDPDGRTALEALSAAFADPHRLVDEVVAAEDDADARRRLSAAFGLTDGQAQTVLDNRFGLLTRARRAELAENLRVAQTPLGPPLQLRAAVGPTGRTATVVVDGSELTGRGRSAPLAVQALATRVREEIARRRHCRVVVTVDGVGGLEGFVATPTWITFDRRDDEAADGA